MAPAPAPAAPRAALGEFAFIAEELRPLTLGAPEALALLDDAALIPGTTADPSGPLLATTDALAEGVHFLPADPKDEIGAKLLRCNLSDAAAMGARPVAAFATLARPPHWSDDDIRLFARGLGADLAHFRLSLLGGDLTSVRGPAAVLSMTVLARAEGPLLTRSGAAAGEEVWVSGTIGDAALGLACLSRPERTQNADGAEGANAPQNADGAEGTNGPNNADAQAPLARAAAALAQEEQASLIRRYRRPEPRLALGAALAHHATAAIDISDGLLADAAKLASASGLHLALEAARTPLSPPAARLANETPSLLPLLLSGGDDYELLFTAPPAARGAIERAGQLSNTPITAIGRTAEGAGIELLPPDGSPLPLPKPGWTHW